MITQLCTIGAYLLITALIAKTVGIRMPEWIEESPRHHFFMKWVLVIFIGSLLFIASVTIKIFNEIGELHTDMVIPGVIVFVAMGISMFSGAKRHES